MIPGILVIVDISMDGAYAKTYLQDAPDYVPGLVATFSLLIVDAILAAITIFFLRRNNKKIALGEMVVENAPDFLFTL